MTVKILFYYIFLDLALLETNFSLYYHIKISGEEAIEWFGICDFEDFIVDNV